MKLWHLPLASLLLIGCGQGDKPGPQGGGTIDRAKYVAAAEPAGAKGIIDVRKEAKDGEEVVVFGRIAGSKTPFTAGRAAFTLFEASKPNCKETGEDCPHPWDYCCNTKEDIAAWSMLIRFTDEQGKTIAADAKSGLGLKEMDTVVIKGKMVKSPDGELTVVASQYFVRPVK